MPLSGINPLSARPRGGVAKVELIPASEYAGVPPSAASSSGASSWSFREDCASYSESAAAGFPTLVSHSLSLEFPATAAARRSVAGLVALSASQGVVAVVTLSSGELLVVGHSVRFGAAYPLRVTKNESVSGRVPADFPTLALTLESIDADPSTGFA